MGAQATGGADGDRLTLVGINKTCQVAAFRIQNAFRHHRR
jgi:hypothetical protein